MSFKSSVKKGWVFLKEDTWQSWLVSLVLVFLFIKFVFFPVLTLISGAPLPLVVVESCSMYHEYGFDKWWEQNGVLYEQYEIDKQTFESFSFLNGLNKGDIVFVWGVDDIELGDVIIFNSNYKYPLIHRVVELDNIGTKGDHNPGQLSAETDINEEQVLGRAVGRVPALGWVKLIFFEGFKDEEQRGFCQ
ncbi:MAG: hypothetical protein AABW79_00840 [Nanoarchaeota archaeon]